MAIALGSNQGHPLEQLKRAVAALAGLLDSPRLGPLYRSAPEDQHPAPAFLNSVVVGRSALTPEMLLAVMKRLEQIAGRRPGKRHAPRPLDLDLILCGSLVSQRPELTLPHPRLARRAFVLEPLAALAPDWPVPPGGETVRTLARRASEADRLEPVPWGDLGSPGLAAIARPPGSR